VALVPRRDGLTETVVRPKAPATLSAELVELGPEALLEQGAILWKEGDPGDHVVLLLEGFVEVTHEAQEGDVVTLRTLEAGAVLGEIASLDGRPRSATVKACSPCRLVRVPAQDFRALLHRRPELMEELFLTQVDRVRSLTRQVTRNHQRAITDPLTHLYNYGFFRERLEIELERARHTGDLVALAIFDIDHFKHFNDVHGHQEGNAVLQNVARILRETGRRGDIVARYGGEEFVALLYGAGRDEARRFAEACRQAIEAYSFQGGETQPLGRVTISGGVAAFPSDAAGDEALIRSADARLYEAKQGGRNRVAAPEP
jgi:diguanylate cyclase (GGDEF)-like protein